MSDGPRCDWLQQHAKETWFSELEAIVFRVKMTVESYGHGIGGRSTEYTEGNSCELTRAWGMRKLKRKRDIKLISKQ